MCYYVLAMFLFSVLWFFFSILLPFTLSCRHFKTRSHYCITNVFISLWIFFLLVFKISDKCKVQICTVHTHTIHYEIYMICFTVLNQCNINKHRNGFLSIQNEISYRFFVEELLIEEKLYVAKMVVLFWIR